MCICIIYLHKNFAILKYFPYFQPIVDCLKDYNKVGNTQRMKEENVHVRIMFLCLFCVIWGQIQHLHA